MIAATAPLAGIFGYVLGINNSFRGIAGEKTQAMANLAGWLSEAGIPAAFGIGVALAAYIQLRAWEAEVERFETEMRCAALELANQLSPYDQGL